MKANELKQDTKNFNKGTARGRNMVADSLREYGAGRSVLVDKNGNILAGNKTLQAAGDMEVEIIPSDGTKIIAVQRTDLDINDPKARALALADNRASEVGLDWDVPALESFKGELPLEKFFDEKELAKMFGEPPADSEELPPESYGLLIENLSEQQQLELLERFTKEGLTCKAMIF